MRRIALLQTQAAVLEKIAERSKMDCWFHVNYYDAPVEENHNTFVGDIREQDINELVDGATEYDIETLTNDEVYCLMNLLIHCKPVRYPEKDENGHYKKIYGLH